MPPGNGDNSKQVYGSLSDFVDEGPAAILTSPNLQDIYDLTDEAVNTILHAQRAEVAYTYDVKYTAQNGAECEAVKYVTEVVIMLRDAEGNLLNEHSESVSIVYQDPQGNKLNLTGTPIADPENIYTISITNTGNQTVTDKRDILAITDLKICDDPGAALAPLNLDDVRQILQNACEPDRTPDASTEELAFTDVPGDSYFYDGVLWAVSNGITKGISDTRFGPTAACNRAQVITFLWRAQN